MTTTDWDKNVDYGLSGMTPCNCIGPQNGEPLCPCQMRGVVVKNGRYVIPEQDLGPVVHEIKPLGIDPAKISSDWK